MAYIKGQAVTGFTFDLEDIAGSAITSGTVTGYVTLDGGTQTALTGTPVHEGNGQWSINLSAAEMNGFEIGLLFVHTDGRTSFHIKATAEPYGETVTGTPSEVAICNIALVRIGQQTITSLTDTTERARVCNLVYEHVRDRVFSRVAPNFAADYVALAQLVGADTYGYTYAYQIPPNTISILEMLDGSVAWKRKADTIVTDETSLSVQVVRRERDTTKWTPSFTEAVIALLTRELAGAIIKAPAVVKALREEEESAIMEAQAADGVEGTADVLECTTLLDVRSQYGG